MFQYTSVILEIEVTVHFLTIVQMMSEKEKVIGNYRYKVCVDKKKY